MDIGESSNAKMGIGRFLSIFSLQSIPRRLSLDFSDLTQKGYSFDSITGDYTLRNGNAFTNNMSITGPVASIAISGRIGLSNQDYDFTMRSHRLMSPPVFHSLPHGLAALSAASLRLLEYSRDHKFRKQ